jgi:bacterioferritin
MDVVTSSEGERLLPPRPALRTREVRDRALFDLDDGPVTPSNHADLLAVTRLLDALLASLLVSSLQYEQHALAIRAPSARPFAAFLFACADRDRADARRLAERIRQLGFVGEYDPQYLGVRSRLTFRAYPGEQLAAIVTQNLVGVRILVQTLQEAVRWLGTDDPTTRRLLERLLEEKETQADGLNAQPSGQEVATSHPAARPET